METPAGRSEACVICPESHWNLWQSWEEKGNLFQWPGERMIEATCPSPQLFVDVWRFLFLWKHTQGTLIFISPAFLFSLLYNKGVNGIKESKLADFFCWANISHHLCMPTSTISQSVSYLRNFGFDLCVLLWGSVIFWFRICLSHRLVFFFLRLFFRETKWDLCIVLSLVKLFAYLSEAESFSNIVSQCLNVNYWGVGILN